MKKVLLAVVACCAINVAVAQEVCHTGTSDIIATMQTKKGG